MTSYICRVRKNKIMLILDLVNEKMADAQTEIVKLGRAVMGKMTRSVCFVLCVKGNGGIT